MRSCVLLTLNLIKMDKLQQQALEKHKIIRYKDLFVKVMNTYKTLLESENEQLRIGAVSICTCGTEEYAENKKREDGFTYCSKCNKKY